MGQRPLLSQCGAWAIQTRTITSRAWESVPRTPHLSPRRAALRRREQAAPALCPLSRGTKRDAIVAFEGSGDPRASPSPGAPTDPTSAAMEWMAGTFGPTWPSDFHESHALMASPPVVFCTRCGRQCSARSHSSGMRAICLAANGEVPRGSTAASRRNALAAGRNPLREGAPLPSRPVRLPRGTHH